MSKFSEDIQNFIQGNISFYVKRDSLPEFIREQILFRMLSCPQCVLSPRCVTCGCTSPNLFFAPNKTDADKKWGKLVTQDEWSKFKQESPSYLNLLLPTPENEEIYKRFNELWTI